MNDQEKAIWNEPKTYMHKVIHQGAPRWMLFDGTNGNPLVVCDHMWSVYQTADSNGIPRPETVH